MSKCRHVAPLIALSVLLVTTTAAGQVTNFSTDVAQSIDDGLAQLDAWGAFNNPSAAADAAGLVLLALLEKRGSADPGDPPQGYDGADVLDQARMENVAGYILSQGPITSFYAYRDGANMMALSLYLRTGGPEPAGAPETLIVGINRLFDRTMAAQDAVGYWCYFGPNCPDASTTQLVVSGLAGVRAIYSDVGEPWEDAARLATLNASAALTRTAYATADQPGGPGGICGPDERGHGYHRNNAGPGADTTGRGSTYENSLQQTASGTWAQLVGGADLNDADVQSYLRWLYNRFRYTDMGSGQWNFNSYYYYLWSSSKAYQFLEDSGVTPDPGNLGVEDIGTVAGGTCGNELQRDPFADVRVPRFGAEGAGYYSDHGNGFYYDYAYSLLSNQTGLAGSPGEFTTPALPGNWDGGGGWNQFSRQSYALLVLQRSVGGGCIDTDGDGVCDADDNCPSIPNEFQEDGDGDGYGDACDACPDMPAGDEPDPDRPGCPLVPEEFTKVLTSGPIGGEGHYLDGDFDLVVEINKREVTHYDFTIAYTLQDNPPVLILDTVPAEWNIPNEDQDPFGDNTLGCEWAPANKKYNNKSASKIWCEEPNDGSLVVDAYTRAHRNNRRGTWYRPTSCGTLMLNEGAEAYEVDEFGDPLVDEFGDWLPPIAVTDGICLAAVYDVYGDGIDYTGAGDEDRDGFTDYEEACGDCRTDPCVYTPDADSDGVPDTCDNCVDTENPGQEDGDGDGIGDVCDPCPEDPDTECVCADGFTCGDEAVFCSGDVADCFCATTAEGGAECLGDAFTDCTTLPLCATSADCPDGRTCAVDTCCGEPVCLANFCSEPLQSLDPGALTPIG